MLVSGKQLLRKAKREGYAVGAFNTNNLETTKAIILAAVQQDSPIFLQLTSGALKYGGFELAGLALSFAREAPVPVAVHLDHGPSVDLARECISFGFSSVMVDGSAHQFVRNVAMTREVVALARKRNVSVEAELGRLKGREDETAAAHHSYTDPAEAVKFVKATGVDALAVAVGTSHGIHKFRGVPGIDLERIAEIGQATRIPLVLHGASSVDSRIVSLANRYGAAISHAKGVPESQIRRAVKLGVCKVNEDTDLRLAFTSSIRKFLHDNRSAYDPRDIFSPAIEAMRDVVMRRIRILGSEGQA